MAEPFLAKDTQISFPHVMVIKASAGSGKTRTLTKRFVQFILSEKIPRNRLQNVLAVTFSNNAAKEMKERTLSWLKSVYFGQEEEISGIVSLDRVQMSEKAGLLIDEILDNYSDFQVKTIDSFMATVFKASAIDFGYNPDFEILMSNDSLMEYSFDLFLRSVREGTDEAASLQEIVDLLMEQKKMDAAYLWDPSAALLDEIKKIYRRLSSTGKKVRTEDFSEDLRREKETITEVIESLEREVRASGLKRHGNSSYKTILPLVRAKSFPDLIGKTFANPPVTKPQKGGDQASYERITRLWSEAASSINRYTVLFARFRCMPYLRVYETFSKTVETTKRQQGKVFIEDINLHLARYLSSAVVPDIYFRIGDTIAHFLIDEFQDTSPIQWKNLFPLIENSLSQGGTLFAVGDTKQAIYGFRNADYAIMKRLESENPFPSAKHEVRELGTNYRSAKRILAFSEKVFLDKVALDGAYREAGERSGLTRYIQRPKEDGGDGYAEVTLLERDDEEPAEREKIQELIGELQTRGYRHGDIAVLTQTNEDAVKITGWLNERDIPFISYSSLDVRRRTITREIVALLNFLDSPTDDLSFGTFVLGEVFSRALKRNHPGTGGGKLHELFFARRKTPPLYKAFEMEFTALWKQYFEGLFRASGFLPLYDLLTEIFAVFMVFETFAEEEATLVKILEVVKDFERAGFNSLKDFLDTATDESGDSPWDMAVPQGIDAVQVMTIHKAKGLGFPVVIVLLYSVKTRGFEYVVEENEDSVTLVKITRPVAACDETLQRLYDEERMRELVNRLNSLYVGFTRPEQELYVIGVGSDDEGYPLALLPVDEYRPSEKPKRILRPHPRSPAAPDPCPLLHRSGPLEFPAAPEEFMGLEERRRGEFFHGVLSLIGYVRDGFEAELFQIIERVRDQTGADYSDDEVARIIMAVTMRGETSAYFNETPGREIAREKEYADGTGRLFRMDRVVLDHDRVTVIDFKTGKNKGAAERYREQMNTYMRILGELYPGKAVKGVISFVDLDEVEKLG